MTMPNSGEKRQHFFHEIEVEETQYEHQNFINESTAA